MVFNHDQELKTGNVPRGGRREPSRGAEGASQWHRAIGQGICTDATSQALSRWPWGAGKGEREAQCAEESRGPPEGRPESWFCL